MFIVGGIRPGLMGFLSALRIALAAGFQVVAILLRCAGRQCFAMRQCFEVALFKLGLFAGQQIVDPGLFLKDQIRKLLTGRVARQGGEVSLNLA
ncbi:hypothetical protein [Pseudomonas capsici]|uniref:hypothetical protein n=1 Tax=Pseudomonas capsici TaxID=2810614 RepID=UPI0021F188E1|nr:hypothetical protein [Pseudomonas capsici]MCV4262030.1 hypothetical protein [Pseudomonas capsici]